MRRLQQPSCRAPHSSATHRSISEGQRAQQRQRAIVQQDVLQVADQELCPTQPPPAVGQRNQIQRVPAGVPACAALLRLCQVCKKLPAMQEKEW